MVKAFIQKSITSIHIIILVIFCSCTASRDQDAEELKLWYTQPAEAWEEALPIGNGRLGAMVYGGPSKEELQLNEETVYAGGPGNNINPESGKSIPQIRRLLDQGKYGVAQLLADSTVKSLNDGMPYQPVGSLLIEFPGHEEYTDYRRELDICEAVARTSYTSGDVTYRREVFFSLSRPGNCYENYR